MNAKAEEIQKVARRRVAHEQGRAWTQPGHAIYRRHYMILSGLTEIEHASSNTRNTAYICRCIDAIRDLLREAWEYTQELESQL